MIAAQNIRQRTLQFTFARTILMALSFTSVTAMLFAGEAVFAQTTPQPLKSIWFEGGSNIEQELAIKGFGFAQKLYYKGDTRQFTIAIAKEVALYGSEFATVPPHHYLSLAVIDEIVYIIDRDGHVIPTPLPAAQVKAWNGMMFRQSDELLALLSYRDEKGNGQSVVVRLKDGATVPISSTYLNLGKTEIKQVNGTISIAGQTIHLSPFESNPGFTTFQFGENPEVKEILAGATALEKGSPLSTIAGQASLPKGQVAPGMARLNLLGNIAMTEEKMYTALSSKIFGQEQLLRQISEMYAQTSVTKMKRPMVVVVTGPSGVGKSYMARRFAKEAFTTDDFFLEIDGNEYKAPHTDGNIEHHKLWGAPAGQQGAQKGQITEWLKKNNGDGVLVINEADKMHPDSWLRMMELFDTGKTTNGLGEVLQTHRLFIILTSNRGTKILFPEAIKDWSDEELLKYSKTITTEKIQSAYKTPMGPDDKFQLPNEVLARVDAFFAANPITKDTAVKIVQDAANDAIKMARTQYDVILDIKPEVIRQIALTGFDSTENGRLLSRKTTSLINKMIVLMGSNWTLEANETVEISLTKDKDDQPLFTASHKGKTLSVSAPREADPNPLRDAELVTRLQNFQTALKSRIVGQDDLLKSVTEALTAQYSDAYRKRPTSLFLIGSTGTGKTETGRAIAFARYGSDKRINIIPFGGVQNEGGFNSIFGVQPGYEGSKVEREFELALRANPDGGVIVFDEISNMGGNNRDLKNALFMKLYNIVEEGKWKSPIDSTREYDLSKYTFVFTGNDGQELFQGITSDDLRMSVWRKENSRSNVRKILLRNGVPEAFINRMADVFLMKPLLTKEVGSIVHKMLEDKIKDWETQHKGIKVTYDSSFESDLAKIFFTQDQGGRGVRKITDDRITAMLSSALITVGAYPTGDTRGYVIHLGVTDNKSKRPYINTKTPPREVNLTIDVSRDGKSLYSTTQSATEFAGYSRLMDTRTAMITAYHEAGHAVLNDEDYTGERLAFVTLFGGQAGDVEYLGYARYEPVPGKMVNPNYKSTIIKIAQLAGGRVAQTMAGFDADAGWSNDLEKIRKYATAYLTKWGLDPELRNLPVDDKGEPILSPAQRILFDQKFDQMLKEGERIARAYLEVRWPMVRTMAAEMLIRGTIDGARYEELKKYVLENPASKGSKRDWTYQQFVEEQTRRDQAAAQKRLALANLPDFDIGGKNGTPHSASNRPKCVDLLGSLVNQNAPQF